MSFGLYYDFRCTEAEPAALTRRWAGILDQVAFAEEIGFGSVWISEHHFTDDGYASSPLTLLGALSARTTTMWLGTNVMVLPVHHPLRLAEEALTVDALSGGRLRLGVGMGYREEDLRPFGTTLGQRRTRFEAALDVLVPALRGEAVDGVRVSPAPVRAGGPPLWLGALSPPAVERAAARADGLLSVLPDQTAAYVEARRRLGQDDGQVAVGTQWIVADDPERAWAALAPSLLYQANAYVAFGMFGAGATPFTEAGQLVELGLYRLMDGAEAVAELRRIIAAGPVVDCFSWSLYPGESLEAAADRLEYFATRVIPAVAATPDPSGDAATRRPRS